MALRLRRVSSLSQVFLGRANFVSKLYLTTLSPIVLHSIRVGSASNAHGLSTNTYKLVTDLLVTHRKVNIAKQPACCYSNSGRRGDYYNNNNKSSYNNIVSKRKVVPPTGIISLSKGHCNRAVQFPQLHSFNNSGVFIRPARAFRTCQPSLKVFYDKKEYREMSSLKVESSTTPDSKKSPSSGSDSPDSLGSSASSKSSPSQVVLRDDVVPQWKIQKENYLKESVGERKDRCKKYTLLENIETWPEYYFRKGNTKSTCRQLNNKVSIWKGDITSLMIDTIVNAANESLMGGGGVDGAIHSASGKHLKQECKTLKPCPTGHAVITGGYELPSKYVIHTVGPRGEDSEKLRSCYENSLNCLLKYELKSIAFPCVSTGIYGYPNDKAAEVVLSTVRKWLEKNHEKVERVIFGLFLEKDIRIYEEKMQKYFPMPSSETDKSGEDESKVKPEK